MGAYLFGSVALFLLYSFELPDLLSEVVEGLIVLPLLKLIAFTVSLGFFTVSLGMVPTDRLASC